MKKKVTPKAKVKTVKSADKGIGGGIKNPKPKKWYLKDILNTYPQSLYF